MLKSLNKLKVLPSIAAGNLLRLEDEVRRIELSGADGIHFDCMDGHFVPLLTIGVPFIEQIKKITNMPLDVHIMVTNPDQVFTDYIHAGADTLTFHIETALHAHRIGLKIKEMGKRAGIALNPSTHWNAIEFLLGEIDVVTVMTVNPGFSRQNHLSFVHNKIAQLSEYRKKYNLKFEIQVDGGINFENIAKIKSLGVNAVIAGGAVFNSENYQNAVQQLKNA